MYGVTTYHHSSLNPGKIYNGFIILPREMSFTRMCVTTPYFPDFLNLFCFLKCLFIINLFSLSEFKNKNILVIGFFKSQFSKLSRYFKVLQIVSSIFLILLTLNAQIMIVTIASTVKQLSLIGQRKKCRKILKTTLIKNSNKQLMCTCK